MLSAPKLFKVLGGSQEVTLDKAPSSAYAEDSWLSVTVSGTSLRLTAKANEQLESRNTLLVVKNATGGLHRPKRHAGRCELRSLQDEQHHRR